MKIFVCIESYLPGTLGGGPVRALANLIEHLGDAHEFFIFTRNRDYLSTDSYPNILPNTWQPLAGASVYYSDSDQSERSLTEQLLALQPDWVYLNGALPPLTRMFLSLRKTRPDFGRLPVLLAPHGNLSSAALAHHRFRKQGWLHYAKARGLYRDVTWHAASEREAQQISAVFGEAAQIRIIPMAPRAAGTLSEPAAAQQSSSALLASESDSGSEDGKWKVGSKEPRTRNQEPRTTNNQQPTTLRLVYFGRLSPEKNLPFAFELLNAFADRHPQRQVVYDLIGAGEPAYEAKLRELSAKLPSSVQVNFIGQLTLEALQARLQRKVTCHSQLLTSHSSRYCAMFMPSLTENFSYTVLESLQAGIPVLISDQTPWRDLQKRRVGWDLALTSTEPWLAALVALSSEIDDVSHSRSVVARQFASTWGEACQSEICQLFEPAQTLENVNATN